MATHDVLHGIGVSAGTAAAPAAIVQPAPGVDTTEPGSVDVPPTAHVSVRRLRPFPLV